MRGNCILNPVVLLAILALPACGADTSSGWQASTRKNPVSDVMNVYLVKAPSSGNVGPLTIRCQNNEAAVVVTIDGKVSGDTAEVTARFDNQAHLSPAQWDTMQGNDGVALTKDGALDLIKTLEKSKTFAVEVRGDTSTTTGTFDVEGLREAMDQFSGFCGWKQLASR